MSAHHYTHYNLTAEDLGIIGDMLRCYVPGEPEVLHQMQRRLEYTWGQGKLSIPILEYVLSMSSMIVDQAGDETPPEHAEFFEGFEKRMREEIRLWREEGPPVRLS